MPRISIGSTGLSQNEIDDLVKRFDLPLRHPDTAAEDDGWLGRSFSGRLVLTLDADDESGDLRTLEITPPSGAKGPRSDDTLLRALGVGRGVETVVDATAGLGRDGLRAALAGARVTMLEREPWLAAMLEDALQGSGERIANSCQIIQGDAIPWLETCAARDTRDRPDTVYLDPMFEPVARGKTALPKMDLQILRALCPDPDAPELARLLKAARRAATRRVVLKRRPKSPHAEASSGRVAEVKGRLARYDIYSPLADA